MWKEKTIALIIFKEKCKKQPYKMSKCNLTSDSDDESGASVTITYDDNVAYNVDDNDANCPVSLNYFLMINWKPLGPMQSKLFLATRNIFRKQKQSKIYASSQPKVRKQNAIKKNKKYYALKRNVVCR